MSAVSLRFRLTGLIEGRVVTAAENYRERAAHEPGTVLLETTRAPGGQRSLFFSNAVEWLEVHRLEDLPLLFGRLEAAKAAGLWAAGYLSYECGYHWEPTAAPGYVPGVDALPLAAFGLFPRPMVFASRADKTAGAPQVEATAFDLPIELFTEKVQRIRRWIEAGDTYQANFTGRIHGAFKADAAQLFARMMEAQPVEFGAMLRVGDRTILSASPELFFRLNERKITVKPMKGTAARGRDAAEDRLRAAALATDAKNRAENVMIVDLLRSDLGRIAEAGSVLVEKLFQVEQFPSLLQMSSEISATLRPKVTNYELFRSLFPCGSVIGAPKVRTMQILRELEGRDRGVYTGAIGFIAPHGEAVFSVAIRTAVVDGARLEMGVGAGITYDSDPAAEYAECLLKGAFLRHTAFQLIETMRWESGRCALLDLHLERLAASAAYFGFALDSAEAKRRIDEHGAALGPEGAWKIRLTLNHRGGIAFAGPERVAPDSGLLTAMLWPTPVDAQDRFLWHKTTRRAVYDEAAARAREQGFADAIFHNTDGMVTEGAIHNIVVRHGDRRRTPPLRDGVLPGVYRAHLLATMPGLKEESFTVRDLLSADEVWLTNAVRGIRVVRVAAGSMLSSEIGLHPGAGQEETMPHDLPKTYDPAAIEERWAARWVSEELWRQAAPDDPESFPPPFTMLLPPPNVTGRLHMGHMLNQTEMDILARWHRMRGEPTLWVPGTDHAGIATQMMVERQLVSEGTSRKDLGRAAFVDRVWQWRAEYGGAIQDQMKRLGASVDWNREYFTMDDGLSRAVREAFVRLHEQGLIYRGKYIVNWDPVQQTAVSDLEVTHEDRIGKLYHVRYELADGTGSIVIATTRPETMLGDVAVAVNPNDARYAGLVGKLLRLPLSAATGGTSRDIPVVADDWANPEFGTGAVKVTPAHDPNDFAIGERHGLPQINIMDAEARIELPGSPYHGLDRYVARERIVEDLQAAGLLVEVKDHAMSIGLSQRTGAVIEPRLSTQWFLKIAPLAEKAIAAVEEGHIRFTPEQYRKTYMEWMRNIHDWCLSRQLWWGHRIPAWFCGACGEVTVARETPPACTHCGGMELTQENDVLDTWFSSGLLPFTVFGWPEKTKDLAAFYPTSLLVTGSDILFFWVARMVMFGCWFMSEDGRELKDAVPFREVYIHALVRDADKQKMSKTKGNVVDPIAIVKQYGTDAVRFTLASMASPGTDIAFSEPRTEGYRAFANKIWNAARFIFMNVDRAAEVGIVVDMSNLFNEPGSNELEARWIRSQFAPHAREVNRALEKYRFDDAANRIYEFFWGYFCDYYLEIVKLRLVFTPEDDREIARGALVTLLQIFDASLRLLSPFMPFLTEELWHAMYDGAPPQRSIALARYPLTTQPFSTDENLLCEFSSLQVLIQIIRSQRKELDIPEKQFVPVRLRVNETTKQIFREAQSIIQRLARVSEIEYVSDQPEGTGVFISDQFDVQVMYERQVDAAAETERLSKDLARLEKEYAGAQSKLGNASFLGKASPAVIDGVRRRAAELVELIAKTRDGLSGLASNQE